MLKTVLLHYQSSCVHPGEVELMASVMGSSLACFSKKVASFTQNPGPDLGWAQAMPLLERWVGH